MHSIHSFKQLLTKKYGFTADPTLPTWKNIQIILLNTPAEAYFSQPISQATFNLANSTTGLPLGTLSLLTLGLKFCLKAPHPTNIINHSIKRFETNVRTKYLMRNQEDSNEFFPQLYIQNPMWSPPWPMHKSKQPSPTSSTAYLLSSPNSTNTQDQASSARKTQPSASSPTSPHHRP